MSSQSPEEPKNQEQKGLGSGASEYAQLLQEQATPALSQPLAQHSEHDPGEQSIIAFPERSYAGLLKSEGENLRGVRVEMQDGVPEGAPLLDVVALPEQVQIAFRQRLETNNGVRVLEEGDQPTGEERKIPINLTVEIEQSQYDEVVARGDLLPNVSSSGRRKSFLTEAEAKDLGLLHQFDSAERSELNKGIDQRCFAYTDADYMQIDGDVLSRTPTVTQVFELASFGKTTRLYNLSKTPITERHMAKVSEALRHMGDLSGETAMNALSVMAVIDQEDPVWRSFNLAEGADRTNASTKSGTIMLSDHLFTDEWERQNQARNSGTAYAVNGGLEGIVTHEMHHVLVNRGKAFGTEQEFAKAVGWDGAREAPRYGGNHTSPTRYGQSDPAEDLAETGTARAVGGKWEGTVSDDRRQAIEGFWTTHRGETYGPAFVDCREVDLHNLPTKFGLNLKERIALEPHYSYSIKGSEASA